MSRHHLEYHDFARIQIDTAIGLYEENNFVCALTLAGAGEELSGKLLLRLNEKPVMHELKRKIASTANISEKDAGDSLNLIRNGFKHVVEAMCEKDIDIELNARILIMRAVVNYCKLCNKKTEAMDRFLKIFEERTNE